MLIKSVNVIRDENYNYILKTEFDDGKIEETIYDNYEDAMNEVILLCNTIKGGM